MEEINIKKTNRTNLIISIVVVAAIATVIGFVLIFYPSNATGGDGTAAGKKTVSESGAVESKKAVSESGAVESKKAEPEEEKPATDSMIIRCAEHVFDRIDQQKHNYTSASIQEGDSYGRAIVLLRYDAYSMNRVWTYSIHVFLHSVSSNGDYTVAAGSFFPIAGGQASLYSVEEMKRLQKWGQPLWANDSSDLHKISVYS